MGKGGEKKRRGFAYQGKGISLILSAGFSAWQLQRRKEEREDTDQL